MNTIKVIKTILNITVVFLPIGYALYTRSYTPLLLTLWGMVGMFTGVLEAESRK